MRTWVSRGTAMRRLAMPAVFLAVAAVLLVSSARELRAQFRAELRGATLVSPADGATVSGEVPLAGSTTEPAQSFTFTVAPPGAFDVAPQVIAGASDGTGMTWTAVWSASALSNGDYTITARALKADGTEASAGPRTVTLTNNVIAPAQPTLEVTLQSPTTGASLSGIAALSASTNVAADSLTFVITPTLGGAPIEVPGTSGDSGTSWAGSWDTAALPNAAYNVVARAFANGSFADSLPAAVTTSNAVAAPPLALTIAAPRPSQTVSGTFLLSATANVAASSVTFTVRDANARAAAISLPALSTDRAATSWTATWNTAAVADGAYTVSAAASKTGESASAGPVSVTVDNVPPLAAAVTSPAAGTTLVGTVLVEASTTLPVDSVSFVMQEQFGERRNIAVAATGSSDTSWSANWNTTTAADGQYSIVANASDGGATVPSAPVLVTVSNAAASRLTVTLTSPAPGAVSRLAGTATFLAATSPQADSLSFIVRRAAATDAAPVATVSGTSSASGAWTGSWDTTGVGNGDYLIVAAGVKGGATVESAAATVSVDNAARIEPVTVTVTAPGPDQSVVGDFALLATANQAVDSLTFEVTGAVNDGRPTVVAATSNALKTAWTGAWNSASTPNGTYTVIAKAVKSGTTTSSGSRGFRVDNVVIAVSIVAPLGGRTVSGTQELIAAAIPSARSLSFRIAKTDDATVTSTRAATFDAGRQAWTVGWDTVDFSNGSYRIEATAVDDAGKQYFAERVIIDVSNEGTVPPAEREFSVRMTAPVAGATISGAVTLSAEVRGETATAVRFSLSDESGLTTAGVDGSFDAARNLWTGVWNPGTAKSGAYTVGAVATDAQNRTAESVKTNFILENRVSAPPPAEIPLSVRLTSPQDGVVSGKVVFSAATEGAATEVSFALTKRGSPGAETLAGAFDAAARRWTAEWDAAGAAIGTYEAMATAKDAKGGSAASNVVTLFVERQVPAPGESEPEEGEAEAKEPAVTFLHPTHGAAVRGRTLLSVSTNFAASRARFSVRGPSGAVVLDRAALFAASQGAWTALWEASGAADGNYRVSAAAFDASGASAAAEIVVKVANAREAPVERVVELPREIVKEEIRRVPEGTKPLETEQLPPPSPDLVEKLSDECAAQGIPAGKCEAWLARQGRATECKAAGILTKEECIGYLKRLHGGTVPECQGLSEEDCAEVIARKTAGFIRVAELDALENAIAPHVGKVVRTPAVGESSEEAQGRGILDEKVFELIPVRSADERAFRVHASPSFARTDAGASHRASPAVLLLDTDEDGLPDDAERRLGTDPGKSDTDGDGFGDAEEMRSGNNPLGRGSLADGMTLAPVDVAVVSGAPLEQPVSAGTVSPDLAVEKAEPYVDPSGATGFSLAGRARPGETVTLFIYSYLPVVLTTEANDDGTWSYDLDSNLVEGEHEVYVTVTDETGKVGEKSNSLSFFVAGAQAATTDEFFGTESEESAAAAAVRAEPVRTLGAWYVFGAVLLVAIALGLAAALFRPKKV